MEHSNFWNKLYNKYCKDYIRMPRTAWYIGKNVTVIPCIPKPKETFFEEFGINREERWKEYTEELRIIVGKKTKWLVESRNNKNVESGSFILSCMDAEDKKELYIKIENCDVKETIQIISMGTSPTGYPIDYDKRRSHIFGAGAYLLKADSNCLYFITDRKTFQLHFHEGTTYTIEKIKTRIIDATTPSNPEFENKIKRDERGRFATQNKSKEEAEQKETKEETEQQKQNTNNEYKEKQHNGIDIIDDTRAYDLQRAFMDACRALNHQEISSFTFKQMKEAGLENTTTYKNLQRLYNKQNELQSTKYIKNFEPYAQRLDKEQLNKSVEAIAGYGKQAQQALKKIYSLKNNVIDKCHEKFDYSQFLQENYGDMIEEGLYKEDDFDSRDCFIEYVEQNLRNPFLMAIYCFSSVADRKFELNNNNMYKALEGMIDNSPFEPTDLFRGNSLSKEIFNQLKPGMSFKEINRQKLNGAPNDFNITNASYNIEIAQEFMQKQYVDDNSSNEVSHYRVMHIFPNSKHIVGKQLSQYGHEEEVYCKMDDKIIDKIYKDGDNVILLYKNKKEN